jgi:thiol-disulfide isomerase/thioredoxin
VTSSAAATRRWGRRRLAAFCIFLGLAAVGFSLLLLRPGSSGSTARRTVIEPPARAPAPPLAGEVLVPPPPSLDRYRGRVLFVNFWASWCRPCRKEAPQLARFAERLDSAQAALVGVDVNDERGDALAFLRRFGLEDANVADTDGALVSRYRIPGLPTTVVVDRDGRIAARLLGPQTVASLAGVLRRVAGARP